MILNELGTEVMGLRVRFWGQEVMVGLGLGWEGTNVILKGLESKVMGFQVGFWGHTVMVGLEGHQCDAKDLGTEVMGLG